MKNKKILILLIIVFLIFITGCNRNSKSGENNSQRSSEAGEDGYEIKNIRMGINDSGKFSVHGSLKNMGGKKEYTEISIPCYDKSGTLLGNAFDSTDSIESRSEWNFKAVYAENGIPANCDVQTAEVTAY